MMELLRLPTLLLAALAYAAAEAGCGKGRKCAAVAAALDDETSLLQLRTQVDQRRPTDAKRRPEVFTRAAGRAGDFPELLPALSNSANTSVGAFHKTASDSDSGMIDLSAYHESSGVLGLYTDPHNSMDLLVDITDLLPSGGGPSPYIMITAMSAEGTYFDDIGQWVPPHEPMEQIQNTAFQFELSPEGQSVDVLQPQLSRRTGDLQTRAAVAASGGRPWIGKVTRLPCTGNQSRVIIDGIELIGTGFLVSPGYVMSSYRILRAKSYTANADVTVQFMDAGGMLHVTVAWSLVVLPEPMMPLRPSDDRLGYFTVDYQSLGETIQPPHGAGSPPSGTARGAGTATAVGSRGDIQFARLESQQQQQPEQEVEVDSRVSVIWRFNLDRLPNHTIRIHVDPTVPARWRLAFKEGIEAWNAAFALAGRPRAVRAVLPDDADWPMDYDIGDARFNTISWCINEGVYSMGIAKVDPRTGEILKSDIVMSDGWVRSFLNDLDTLAPVVTTSVSHGLRVERRGPAVGADRLRAVAEGGRVGTPPLRDDPEGMSLLGTRAGDVPPTDWQGVVAAGLREIVMHETGHVLGLRHNFKGSLGVSNECLQDSNCTSVSGTGSSVMDYNPINMPMAGLRAAHAFAPVVGTYDKLAIQYGYSNATQLGPTKVPPELQQILAQAEGIPSCSDGEYQYGQDPLCEMYDLGSNPLLYYRDQLELMRRRQEGLLNTSTNPGEPYTRFGRMVRANSRSLDNIAVSLTLWIGGVNTSRVHRGYDGSDSGRASKRPISAEMQREALRLLLQVLRPSASGLLPPPASLKFIVEQGGDGVTSWDLAADTRSRQNRIVPQLLSPRRLQRLEAGVELGGPSIEAILGDLFDEFSGSLSSNMEEDWDLQRRVAAQVAMIENSTAVSAGLAAHGALARARFAQGALGALEGLRRQPEVASDRAEAEELRAMHLMQLLRSIAPKVLPSELAAVEAPVGVRSAAHRPRSVLLAIVAAVGLLAVPV